MRHARRTGMSDLTAGILLLLGALALAAAVDAVDAA
jgi:hypothetical protein